MTRASEEPPSVRIADGTAKIVSLGDRTGADPLTGAVHSVQAAEMLLSGRALEALWSEAQLERMARTYWRFLARITLGIVHVHYTARERFVVLFARPFKLLTFSAPEYELGPERGLVRWRIDRGLLVAKAGHGGGHLQIELRRDRSEMSPSTPDGLARLHIEVEVANFYPAIAFGLSSRLYNLTQAKIHVFVTRAFLRSLARLDFPSSKVGRFDPSRSDRRH